MSTSTLRSDAEDVLYSYVEAADALDAERVAELLCNAEVDFGGSHADGRDDIATLYRHAFATSPPARHLVANIRIDVHDDRTASLRAAYVRWPATQPGPPLGLGDYEFDLARRDDQWSISRLAVRRRWTS